MSRLCIISAGWHRSLQMSLQVSQRVTVCSPHCQSRRQVTVSNPPANAYDGVPTRRLMRALFVFQMCSYDWLVDRQANLMKLFRRLVGKHLYEAAMRATVFGQFIPGEEDKEILITAGWLASRKVIPMFAYTSAETPESQDDDGQTSVDSSALKKFREENFKGTIRAINLAAKVKEFDDNFPQRATSKVCFFVNINTLKRLSRQIVQHRQLLSSNKYTPSAVQSCLSATPSSLYPSLSKETFSSNDKFSEYTPSMMTNLTSHLKLVHSGDKSSQILTDADCEHLEQSWAMMDSICKYAAEKNVQMIWDAEQSYLQPAIECIIIDLMRRYNRSHVHIFNTYQCYLKSAKSNLLRDLRIANTEGFHLGAKVVRGAYMDEERRLARENNYEDPINDSFEATTQMYEMVGDCLLNTLSSSSSSVANSKKPTVIFATHNSDTVNYIMNRMRDLNLVSSHNIAFAQLLGMRDHLTYSTANRKFRASKLLHFGSLEQVTAYLSRRLLENRSALPSADLERELLRRELRHRLLGR